MNTKKKEFLEEILESMDGHEIWTDVFGYKFGERVCIMIDGKHFWNNGKKYKMPMSRIKELAEDRFRQEFGFGSDSPRFKELEKEFGTKEVAK